MAFDVGGRVCGGWLIELCLLVYTNEATACLCAHGCLYVVLEGGEGVPLGISKDKERRKRLEPCI